MLELGQKLVVSLHMEQAAVPAVSCKTPSQYRGWKPAKAGWLCIWNGLRFFWPFVIRRSPAPKLGQAPVWSWGRALWIRFCPLSLFNLSEILAAYCKLSLNVCGCGYCGLFVINHSSASEAEQSDLSGVSVWGFLIHLDGLEYNVSLIFFCDLA